MGCKVSEWIGPLPMIRLQLLGTAFLARFLLLRRAGRCIYAGAWVWVPGGSSSLGLTLPIAYVGWPSPVSSGSFSMLVTSYMRSLPGNPIRPCLGL